MDRRTVERCSGATLGGEELVTDRVINDANERLAVDHEPDRNGEEWDPIRKVHRSVDRVNDPESRRPCGAAGATLFAEQCVARQPFTEKDLSEQRLRGAIGGGHHVVAPLRLGHDRRRKCGAHQFAGGARGAHR